MSTSIDAWQDFRGGCRRNHCVGVPTWQFSRTESPCYELIRRSVEESQVSFDKRRWLESRRTTAKKASWHMLSKSGATALFRRMRLAEWTPPDRWLDADNDKH